MPEIKRLERVRHISKKFCSQYGCFKSYSEHYDSMQGKVPILITNNFFDIALLHWAHLFGNWNDDLHYSNVVTNSEEFKSHLLNILGLNESEWQSNWDSLKSYRDQRVAHIDPAEESIVPELDLAFKAIGIYYKYATDRLIDLEETVYFKKSLDTILSENSEYYREAAEMTVGALKI